MLKSDTIIPDNELSFDEFKATVLNDYSLVLKSREASLMGRREVLTGKAKFGIFGDGKELPQIAMAKVFRKGDFRSGYYRDQTFMMAIDALNVNQMFAGLYAHADVEADPSSGGRQMGGHFSTAFLNEDGSWKNLTEQYNSSSDISCTAGQMPRLLGLAQASKLFREIPELKDATNFSKNGNEVAFGTIGNASTSEGHFWETMNAAGVMQVPMIMSVWDDDYGISVPAKYQTTKESISEILAGFQRDENNAGIEIIKVKAWDYPALIAAYSKAEKIAREEHVPVLVHVVEVTQPQGHSTSGSHERYKTPERLQWEKEYDCNLKFREWILEKEIAGEEELVNLEKDAKKHVREAKVAAWKAYQEPMKQEREEVVALIENIAAQSDKEAFILPVLNELKAQTEVARREILAAARKVLRLVVQENMPAKAALQNWIKSFNEVNQPRYSSHLYSQSEWRPENITPQAPNYTDDSELVDARIILRENFDQILAKHPEVVIFGEDAGNIGDVNQGLEGLQEKYGESRVFDTGIREATILGQAVGLSMRGMRPIAEIQYLDYILYALQTMSDDLATVHYRSAGGQKAPAIIRTRGHRLEGIWHSGSPMGGLINLLRGMHLLVPRNMTKAAGFYNTLLESDDPAVVVECLNGYRLKEKMPENLSEIKTPIGVVETIKEGSDVTLVSYGSTLRIVEQAAKELQGLGIDAEVIDVQSLLPFDLNHDIVKSVEKTNRLVVIDEDVPGGASAYILQEILEKQNAYFHLDSKPMTITSRAHRPAYADDGDYFSKPSLDDIVERVYDMMREVNPSQYPPII